MTDKVLIAFATKSGATQDTAQQIAQTLRNQYALTVDLVDLHPQPHPDVSGYGTIVVASGVRMGKWYKEALQFLGSNFEGKKVALFVSALYQGENPKTYPNAVQKYLKEVAEQHLKAEPVAMEVFGGRMKFAGRVTSENRDLTHIDAWANSLGEKLRQKLAAPIEGGP